MKLFKQSFYILGFVSLFLTGLILPRISLASDLSVSPLIIDQTVTERDVINREITIKNNTNRKILFYAAVNEIVLDENGETIKEFVQAAMSDRTQSITSWIEITRARQEVEPFGEVKIPLIVKTSPTVVPGEYRALVSFTPATKRSTAEADALAGLSSGVILRLSVAGQLNETLKLVSFKSPSLVTDSDGKNFILTLENTGDVPVSPTGEVIVYNHRGEELTSLTLNQKDQLIKPGEQVDISTPVPETTNLGRNKVMLALEYGQQKATVYDTNFYYSVPLFYLALAVLVLLLVPLLLTAWIRRFARVNSVYYDDEEAKDIPVFVNQTDQNDKFPTSDNDINLKNNP